MTTAPTDFPFGYCTNVHAGTTLDAAQANLVRYATPIRQQLAPSGRLPVGLWLAEPAARELLEADRIDRFGSWLDSHGFLPYTLNGFPQHDFHQPVVKHAVYEPTWMCQSRADYTMMLVEILALLLPERATGSISTLPLGWPHAPWHAEDYHTAAEFLWEVAEYAQRIEQESGRHIVIAIEPEPGCVLNTADEVVEFFEHFLFRGPAEQAARHHLSVCHDICHSGVMFESQMAALERYHAAGIRIGKVQVSSAVHVPWDRYRDDLASSQQCLEQLQTFNEPKFLHQTTESTPSGNLARICEDLPQALDRWVSAGQYPSHPWRIHFHVPVFVDRFELLETTQADIAQVASWLHSHSSSTVGDRPWFTGHYEVETYAWTVLPPSLAQTDLADGITQELQYFANVLRDC
ncbi:MAG: hypothetical protein D6753_17325 [Planctomycetota bacterium]|nr:MAG: hypothetical protein D6753_17325 [Planctomycetota bacterium]